MLFALVASGLWIVNSLYSIGYMRGNGESHQTRFYVCFALALASTIGIAFAANVFTLLAVRCHRLPAAGVLRAADAHPLSAGDPPRGQDRPPGRQDVHRLAHRDV